MSTATIPTERSKSSGAGHPRWRGGEWLVGGGYVRCTINVDRATMWPTALRHGRSWSIQRTHLVWNEAHPDDLVQRGEEIHHVNRNRTDDRIDNLQKMTKAEHKVLHDALGDRRGPKLSRRTDACINGHPAAQYRHRSPSGKSSWCTECNRIKMATRRAAARVIRSV